LAFAAEGALEEGTKKFKTGLSPNKKEGVWGIAAAADRAAGPRLGIKIRGRVRARGEQGEGGGIGQYLGEERRLQDYGSMIIEGTGNRNMLGNRRGEPYQRISIGQWWTGRMSLIHPPFREAAKVE